jgi:hypothetical protein
MNTARCQIGEERSLGAVAIIVPDESKDRGQLGGIAPDRGFDVECQPLGNVLGTRGVFQGLPVFANPGFCQREYSITSPAGVTAAHILRWRLERSVFYPLQERVVPVKIFWVASGQLNQGTGLRLVCGDRLVECVKSAPVDIRVTGVPPPCGPVCGLPITFA